MLRPYTNDKENYEEICRDLGEGDINARNLANMHFTILLILKQQTQSSVKPLGIAQNNS